MELCDLAPPPTEFSFLQGQTGELSSMKTPRATMFCGLCLTYGFPGAMVLSPIEKVQEGLYCQSSPFVIKSLSFIIN